MWRCEHIYDWVDVQDTYGQTVCTIESKHDS